MANTNPRCIAATNIVELIGRTVVAEKGGEKIYLGLCPFHSEKSPSFNVDPVKQFFHCFGCKATAMRSTFVMKRDRSEFIDALQLLGRCGWNRSAAIRRCVEGKSRAAEAAFEMPIPPPACSLKSCLRTRARASRPGVSARARIQRVKAIKNFQIGFAADAWDALLEAR